MLFDTFYSWGHPAREIAKMTIAPSTEPNRFNANYIKTQRRLSVPVPRVGPPTLPSKGSDQWGQLIAKAVSTSTAKVFNKNYLKPNPDNLRHIPPPRLYTKEGALAQLKGAESESADDKVEAVSPIEKATRIAAAQEDGSDLEKYWNDIIVSLTQLKDIQATRPLTSQELQVQTDILQIIKDYELTNNTLTSPGPMPAAGPGSTAKIQAAIAAIPAGATAADIRAIMAALPAPATNLEIEAIMKGLPQPATELEIRAIMSGLPQSPTAIEIGDAIVAAIKKGKASSSRSLSSSSSSSSAPKTPPSIPSTPPSIPSTTTTNPVKIVLPPTTATPPKIAPPPKNSTYNELKDFVRLNKLSVSLATGGASKRTLNDIYKDIIAALSALP